MHVHGEDGCGPGGQPTHGEPMKLFSWHITHIYTHSPETFLMNDYLSNES